ncbi:hypothetical protein pb186bvf_003782 [Paramecium bursaria]
MQKQYIQNMLFLSKLKREYLEFCLDKDIDPDSNLLGIIQIAEQEGQIKNFDLSTVQTQTIKVLLPFLKSQNNIDQISISGNQANELAQELQDVQCDIQIKKRIPQLDLQMISSSSGNLISQRPSLYKSPSNIHFNTDRIQQLQSDRINSTNRAKKSTSPNTKVVNLNLKSVEQKKKVIEFLSKPAIKKPFVQQKQVVPKKERPNPLESKKQSQHSFSKHKNTSSSPINEHSFHNDPQTPIISHTKRQTSIYQNKANKENKNYHIPIKQLLDSQQMNTEFISRKIGDRKVESSRGAGFKQQLHTIVSTERNENDISIHLKNLINFCNQSIQRKEKTKPTEHTMIRLTELVEEDNPETARFNSEEDVRVKSKGLQRILQKQHN